MTAFSAPINPADVRRVSLPAIERELAAAWRAQAEALKRTTEDEPSLNRILLLTLVVYAPETRLAEQAREMVAMLNPRQPARTIVIEVQDETGQPAPEAWVALHCASLGGGRRGLVCGEHVMLKSGSAAAHRLPGAVLPLLLPNVPSFLWWQSGNPFQHPLLKEFSRAVDRLIVDTLTFDSPRTDLPGLARALADPAFHPIVSDLNWARTDVWRHQTAQLFDDPALLPYLKRLAQVHIAYEAGTPMLAWLYACWLASRLGWRPVTHERGVHGLRFAQGQSVELESVTVGEGGTPGQLLAVRFEAYPDATFEVVRTRTRHLVTRLQAGSLTAEHAVPVRGEDPVECLENELTRLAPAPTYEAAVRLLAGVLNL